VKALQYTEVTAGGEPPVLQDFSLAIEVGHTVVLSGSEDSGKFLLFQLALGMVSPQRGEVRTLGVVPDAIDLDALRLLRARCGLVPHHGALVSNLSVYDNVALPLRYHGGLTEAELSERAIEALSLFGLQDHLSDRPAGLGEVQQRQVAMARVRAMRPEIVLVQDPFEGMDEIRCNQTCLWHEDLADNGAAVMITTNITRLGTTYDGRLLRLVRSRVVQHQR